MAATPFTCCPTRVLVLGFALAVSGWAIRLALDDRLSPGPRGAIVLSPPSLSVADRYGWVELTIVPPLIGREGGPAGATSERTAGGAGQAHAQREQGVIPLGALLEMRIGEGMWQPLLAEGVAADGLVAVFHDPVLVHVPTPGAWERYAFRARTLIITSGVPPGGVVSGPLPAGGRTEPAPGRSPGRVLGGAAVHPDAPAQGADERRYCSDFSDERSLIATGDVHVAFVKAVPDPDHPQAPGALFEVSKLIRDGTSEAWVSPPVECTLHSAHEVLEVRKAVVDPLDGVHTKRKMLIDFYAPFQLMSVNQDVTRILYYELKAKARGDGSEGRDIAIMAKMLQTEAVALVLPSGGVMTFPRLTRITRPPQPSAIIYPDYPAQGYDELAEFRKDPAAFRQWGLIPAAPVAHAAGTGPLREWRLRTGDPALATDTTYYELADGRLVYWEPRGESLQVYPTRAAAAVLRAARLPDARPPPLSHAALPEVRQPFWAAAAGSDATGPWADLVLRDVRSRLRWIPPGAFTMGSPEAEAGRDARELAHRVELSSGFWLMDGPCTQALWQEVMAGNPSRFADDPQAPVEGVSFADVQGFIVALNQRLHGDAFSLPSEAQFEYASRAGLEDPYGGTALDAIGWHAGNSAGRTHPVRSKQANRWGLFDLHGNVWEWCADWHGSYPAAAVPDPQGPDWGTQRVIRGGSWASSAARCRAACRSALEPLTQRQSTLGFRLCAPALPPGIQPVRARTLPAAADGGRSAPGAAPASRLDAADWAAATGVDRYGRWADLELKGARQRLRWIPAGWFTMGSPADEEGRGADEGQHGVRISRGFWMADSACTQALWQAVMGSNPAHFSGDLQRPVESVSWWEVGRFLTAVQSVVASGRVGLPSEAQREYACRAGTGGPFAGPSLDAIAWFGGNSGGTTHAKKQRAPNAWGLYDLQGEVWEWCSDWYGAYPAPGGADEVGDPQGPDSGEARVVRGGSWAHGLRFCRAAHRDYLQPDGSTAQVGFRFCIMDYWR